MVKEFENLTQLNRFEKLNKSKKIIDIVYNAENKLWIVTFNVLRLCPVGQLIVQNFNNR